MGEDLLLGPPEVALPAVGADEAGWWAAVLGELLPVWHPLVRAYLERARPACRTGVTLIVVAHSDGEGARLAREVPLLSDAMARASGGAVCEVLVVSPQQWRARAADVGGAAQA